MPGADQAATGEPWGPARPIEDLSRKRVLARLPGKSEEPLNDSVDTRDCNLRYSNSHRLGVKLYSLMGREGLPPVQVFGGKWRAAAAELISSVRPKKQPNMR